jgi:CheY-like chemotaxis protein
VLSGRTIVVVATPDRHAMLAQTIEDAGGYPVPAPTVADAVRVARVIKVDGLVLDATTPGIDPHELLRRLRAEPKLAHVRAVAIGADAVEHPGYRVVRHARLRWVHQLVG